MVFKAFRRKLRVSEIPIDYYPRVGESKLNRFGDAWRHVKFMLLYSPSWLFFVPGLRAPRSSAPSAPSRSRTRPVQDPRTGRGRSTRCSSSCSPSSSGRKSSSSESSPACSRPRTSGRPTALVEWARGRFEPRARPRTRRAHPAPAGILTVTVIFVAWALDGFGALAHEYATALGFTLIAVGTQVVLGLVLHRPSDDAHHRAFARQRGRLRDGRGGSAAFRARLSTCGSASSTTTCTRLPSAAASAGCTISRSPSHASEHEVTYLTMRHWKDEGPSLPGCASGWARLRGLGVRGRPTLAGTPSPVRCRRRPLSASTRPRVRRRSYRSVPVLPVARCGARRAAATPTVSWPTGTRSGRTRTGSVMRVERSGPRDGWSSDAAPVSGTTPSVSRDIHRPACSKRASTGTSPCAAGPLRRTCRAVAACDRRAARGLRRETREGKAPAPAATAASRRPGDCIPSCASRSTETGRTGRPRSERRLALA